MITQLEEGEPPNPPRIKADQYWPDRFNYLVCSYLFICLFLTREDRQINLVCFCLFVCLFACLFVCLFVCLFEMVTICRLYNLLFSVKEKKKWHRA